MDQYYGFQKYNYNDIFINYIVTKQEFSIFSNSDFSKSDSKMENYIIYRTPFNKYQDYVEYCRNV